MDYTTKPCPCCDENLYSIDDDTTSYTLCAKCGYYKNVETGIYPYVKLIRIRKDLGLEKIKK